MKVFQYVIFLLLSLSGFSTASQMQNRWLAARTFDFFRVYLCVLAFTVVWGLAFVSGALLLPSNLGAAIVSLPLGWLAGHAALRADRSLTRKMTRAASRRSARERRAPVSAFQAESRRAPSSEPKEPEVVVLLGIAVLEEVVHRGMLVDLALRLPVGLTVLVLAVFTVLFCAAHLHFGFAATVAKLPLALLTLGTVLITQTVWPAIIAHVLFNYHTWRTWGQQPQVITRGSGAPRIPV